MANRLKVTRITGTTDQALEFFRDADTPADQVGFAFVLKNDAAEETNFARILGEIVTDTDGAEDGQIAFECMSGGALVEVGVWNQDGDLDIVGALSAVGVLSTSDNTVEKDGGSVKTTWISYGGTPQVFFDNANGTKAAQTVVLDNEILGQIVARGHDATDMQNAAIMRIVVDGTPANNDVPGSFEFHTYIAGVLTKVATLRNNGDLELHTGTIKVDAMPTSNPGAGYLWNNSNVVNVGT